MNTLYPLKFKPIYKEKIWGGSKIKTFLQRTDVPFTQCGESWEVSAVQDNVSVVSNGFLAGNTLNELIEVYMNDLVGDKVFEQFSVEFPLLIKVIDATMPLSVQVHPNNELAKKRHNAYGKSEMWYVLEAGKNSELISGFNRKMKKEELTELFNSGKIKDLLKHEPVKAGDVFYIPSGQVHSIGTDILLVEVQQTSDITYRIYDWDRTDSQGNKRELHTALAIDAIDLEEKHPSRTPYSYDKNETANIIQTPFFTTNILNINTIITKNFEEVDSFVIYICIEGSADIACNNRCTEKITKGETVLIPAMLDHLTFFPRPETKLLEVYI